MKFPGSNTRRTMGGETISETARVSDMEAARTQAYADFISEPKPQVSDEAFNRIWRENIELRENMVLCQTELNRTHEATRGVYRQYAEKCRELERVKLETANEVYRARESVKAADKARSEMYCRWVNARGRLKSVLSKLPKKDWPNFRDLQRSRASRKPKPDRDPLDMPIEEMVITTRLYRCLKYGMNAETVRDVLGFTATELLICPNFGKVTLKELEECLRKMGMELKK